MVLDNKATRKHRKGRHGDNEVSGNRIAKNHLDLS
jgi:hypothetical protein